MSILKRLEVNETEGLTYTQQLLSNDDLLPVPLAKRTWSGRNFVYLWISDSFNINTWMIGSSMIQLGLSWWQAWICVWIGYAITGPFVALNARQGAVFHITFPVAVRTSFGLYGSLWCTLNRGAMACIWYGIQTSIGGDCVRVMLRSMWPSVNDIPNNLPVSSGTTTRDFMCFFLFWLISLPAIWFPIHQIRHLFTVKAVVVPIAGITFFVWCIVKAKGVGTIISQPATVRGSDLGWGMIVSIMSCISNFLTIIVNAPDFASRATTPSAAFLPQIFAPPITFGIISFLGIIVSSSSTTIYGEAIWSPIDLLDKFLDGRPSHATRFGVWFISASFILAQVGNDITLLIFANLAILNSSGKDWILPLPPIAETTDISVNISANSISAGCDLTALLPRFLNIRRGGYIAAVVAICMQPWNLLKNSNSFTNYLSAYSVFLSSVAGVMITEYYVVRKGHYRVADLYDSSHNGWYWYTYGVNFRAYVAYIAGILINVVGFAGATGRPVPLVAIRIYQLAFFTGFIVSSVVYWGLNAVFPVPGMADKFKEVDESGYLEQIEEKSVAQAEQKSVNSL